METAYIATGEILVYIACLLAAIGAFLPVLPGPLLSFAAILVFKLVFPESGVGWLNVWICGFLAAFAQLADIFMSWLGAKKFGATWRGGLGAFIGVFVGIFLPPPIFWIFVAPLAGAFLGEWLGGANIRGIRQSRLGCICGRTGGFNDKISDCSVHGRRIYRGGFQSILKIVLTHKIRKYFNFGFNSERA